MEQNENSSEYFEFAGVRRKFTTVNTFEARENWFKTNDNEEVQRLMSRIKPLPVIAPTPSQRRNYLRPHPTELITVLVLITTSVLGSRQIPFLIWGTLLSIPVLLWPILLRKEILQLSRIDSKKSWRKPLRISVSVMLFLVTLNTERGDNEATVIKVFLILVVLLVWKFDLVKFQDEKRDMDSFNARVDLEQRDYEKSIAVRNEVERNNSIARAELDALALECLELSQMLSIRRDLIDQVLEAAFAELGVSTADQQLVLSDRDRFIVEITGPTSGEGAFRSMYPQPILEFPLGLPRQNRYDTPALIKYLSHLYVCRIGIVLPQGFGYFEAIVDSVEMHLYPRGHELLVWKAISRVARMNAGSEFGEDKISIQTYGGSETVLPVNGMFVNEQQEKVETIDPLQFQAFDSSDLISDSDYQVNSFVLSVQQHMAAAN